MSTQQHGSDGMPSLRGPAKQPQRREQQEWTPELEKLVSDALDNTITALGQCQKGTARQFLRSVINAALAAERSNLAIEHEARLAVVDELTTERQRREPTCKCVEQGYPEQDCQCHGEIKQLRQQLMSARAAIEKLTVEVRNPLVEALEAIRKSIQNLEFPTKLLLEWLTLIDDALTKVKGASDNP